MPVIFVGHGSPENSIENNEFTKSWKELAKSIPKPKCILCISAHWLLDQTRITAMNKPKTIHDFYGFQDELYAINYPASGSKEFAESIKNKINTVKVELDQDWGLDHGTWSVLVHMYPKANIPVLQLSLNDDLPLNQHFEIGKELIKLRDEGILIIGSGNIVHNLMRMNPGGKPFDWAIEFDKWARDRLIKKDYDALINYSKQKSSHYAVPTNEHYLPLLYVIGASDDDEPMFLNEKIFYASLSMRCVIYGLNKI